ncbi:hypothetical protein, partial [Bacillus sp. V33-4]|uniref:hypothetical protein n=1 Tax=Bacillus sp. V33-4 TaxID=2054169 RepID=UPI000CB7E7AB
VRTGQGQKSEIQSESGSGSDRAGPKKRNPVRKRVWFGQSRGKKAKSSQKASQVRTEQGQKSEIQSESESGSDRAGVKKRNPVRKRVWFGQRRAKKAKSSQKAGLVRTGQGQKSEIAVTKRVWFGQGKAKKARSSHKRVWFGQGKAKKARSSHKAGLVRTGQGQKSEIQSESESGSDSAGPKKRKPVRMRTKGQIKF